MRFLLSALLAAIFMLGASAQAAVPASPAPYTVSDSVLQPGPDLVSFSVGYMNFDKSEPKTNSADFRVEYRFGYSFWHGDTWGFHPMLGFETTSRNLLYGLGGFSFDWDFTKHGIFTWSEGAGYLDSGDQRTLGGTFQFRSMAEAGYRFDNDMRITAAFSHISDAKLTRVNPGAEIIGMYLHMPVGMMFGPSK